MIILLSFYYLMNVIQGDRLIYVNLLSEGTCYLYLETIPL